MTDCLFLSTGSTDTNHPVIKTEPPETMKVRDGSKYTNSVKQNKPNKQRDALSRHFITSTLLGDVDDAGDVVSLINDLKMPIICSLENKKA